METITCPVCQGSAEQPGFPGQPCLYCGGDGLVPMVEHSVSTERYALAFYAITQRAEEVLADIMDKCNDIKEKVDEIKTVVDAL